MLVARYQRQWMQIGVDSFAARFADNRASLEASASDSLRNLVQRIELADQVGLDVVICLCMYK